MFISQNQFFIRFVLTKYQIVLTKYQINLLIEQSKSQEEPACISSRSNQGGSPLKKIHHNPNQSSSIYCIVNVHPQLDNKTIDTTQTIAIQSNIKNQDLLQLKSLLFQTKNETFKYPILIEIIYGDQKPKKIILRRSDMLKQYQTQQKTQFFVNQDFGTFSIYYQVNIHDENNQSTQPKQNIDQIKNSNTNKDPENPRNIKRPSMLKVSDTTAKLRKMSGGQKQLAESIIKIQSGTDKDNSNTKNIETSRSKTIPQLTLSKQQGTQQRQIVKKDIKINLFQTFQHGNDKLKNKNPEGPADHMANHHSSHRSSHSHGHNSEYAHPQNSHSQHSHGQKHQDHGHGHGHDDHGHGHDDHGHGHDQGFHLSYKLKTVILMLIIGFLFLMYDALDDRFSRKISKSQHRTHKHSHGHGKSSQNQQVKRKKVKKQKKIVNHQH